MSKKFSMTQGMAAAVVCAAMAGMGTAVAANGGTSVAAAPVAVQQASHPGAVSALKGVETTGRRGAVGWSCPPACPAGP